VPPQKGGGHQVPKEKETGTAIIWTGKMTCHFEKKEKGSRQEEKRGRCFSQKNGLHLFRKGKRTMFSQPLDWGGRGEREKLHKGGGESKK